eukprot:TRINITY_DN6738_c0_g1_i1.p2 TRINITY_DN6738_c0_g1~~TRINITY_DN6738_c0_g1_i1.p2  ORF type:complete len:345 (-),score=98.30 TRINITY_DN6738_c0_g1_i1:469-1503(-)
MEESATPAPKSTPGGWQRFDDEKPPPEIKPWHKQLWEFLGPSEDQYRQYFAGLIFDLTGLLVVIILILTLLTGEEITKAWPMPFLGIIAATIAMATPAGGGIVYFPVLTLFNINTEEAIAFSLASQFIGSGVFGTVNWMRKSWSSIILWICCVLTIFGWAGAVISSLYFGTSKKFTPRLTFSVFSLFLALYIIYGLKKGELIQQQGEVPKTWLSFAVMAVMGFVGGLLVGYISVGIDTLFFFVVCSVYHMDSRLATVNSILVIGWCSFVPFLLRLFYFKNVRLDLWLMAIIGIIFGARIGPIINKKVGRRRMLIIFVILLLIETIRTFVELFVVPPIKGEPIYQ